MVVWRLCRYYLMVVWWRVSSCFVVVYFSLGRSLVDA